MEKKLINYLFLLTLSFCCLAFCQKSFAQTPTFTQLTGGLSANPPNVSTGAVVYGFSVAVSGGGSITFKQFNIGSQQDASASIANGTLYRSPTSTFSSGTPGTPVGNVTISSSVSTSAIIIDNFSDNIASGSTNYYFLVVDVISSNYCQLFVNSMPFATDVNGTVYNCGSMNFYNGYNYNPVVAYPLRIAPATAGLTSNSTSLVAGSSGVAVFGFGLSSSGTNNITAININSNITTLSQYFSSFTLWTTGSTATYSGAATQVSTGVTVTMSAGYVNIAITGTNLQATTTKTYYWLIANVKSSGLGTLPVSPQFKITNGQSTTSFTSVVSYNTATVFGPTYNVNSASVTITSEQTGVSSGTITAGQTGIVLFGFGVSASSAISVSQFNINSTGAASTYFGNAKLYRNTTNNYATGVKTLVGTTTFSGNYANVAFSTLESITTTPQYYFLVADDIGANASHPTIAFNFTNGQTTNAVVQTSPVASTYNTFAITGNTFTIPSPSVSYAVNTTGYTTPSTIVSGQTAVLYGFTATPIGTATITSPYINFITSAGNPGGLFSSLQVWVSTTGSYATATLISGTTIANGAGGLKAVLPSTLTLTAGTSYTYYLVGMVTGSSALPASFPISSGGLLSDNGGNSYSTTLASTTYTITTASVSITGNNTAAAGITQGSLSYGQTGIVLFSFKLVAQGAFTISTMSIPSSNNMNAYFTNGKVYRSTTAFFTNATLVSGAAVSFSSGNHADLSALSQTFTATPTTYYYFIVADLTASTGASATTVQYNFTGSQSPSAINSGSGAGDSFNGFTTTDGNTFNIVTVYKWTGSVSSDFSVAGNFTDLGGSGVSAPGSTITVEIGVSTYTNAPNITANTTIGGLTFGAANTPTLTLTSGKTLTLNNGISVINGASPAITGAGTVTIGSSGISALSPASTLNISAGASLTNAGTFTMASTSVLNLNNGNTTVANTGTFILASDANGSATIGQLTGSSTVTGTYIVQRYMTGGTISYRGYRMLSSPVHSGSTAYYDLAYLKGAGTYLTGAAGGGWDVTGNATLYLYRQDMAPNNASFTSGNYRPVTAINNSPNAYLIGTQDGNFNLGIGNGFLMFYRGNNGTLTTTVPNSLVFSASGTINKGPVLVKPWTWTTGPVTLAYSSVTGNSAVKGYNLVGNPFPSTIDWETYSISSMSNGIYAPNVGNTIYIVDPVSQGYATYQAGTHASAHNGSRYIPSGQGFFVLASASASLTFNENAKVTNQVTGTSLLLNSTVDNNLTDKHIRLQLYKDAVINDDIYIGFRQNASTAYVYNEDAMFKAGGSKVSLSSMSSDNLPMSINFEPLPTGKLTIPLTVKVNATGTYQLNMTEALNIPDMFDVWLMDNYKKDSLDVKHNPTYSFNASSDTSSYGSTRFTLVIRQNPDKAVHLLTFTGTKATSAVNLSWKTENESNYTQYILERTIDAGKTYSVLDSVKSANLGTYNDIDPSPTTGLNQYRLKQIDVLGNISYSNIVNIMYSLTASKAVANSLINIFPNPVSNTLNLSIIRDTEAAGHYKISITNTSGIVVKTATSSNPEWHGDVNQLSPGTYFVQVINTNNNTVTGKRTFIKL